MDLKRPQTALGLLAERSTRIITTGPTARSQLPTRPNLTNIERELLPHLPQASV